MINQLLKLGLFVALGVWLKNRGKALLLLVIVLVVTWIAHNEYLSYISQSEDDQFLGISYGIKWGIFILAIITYYIFVEKKIKQDPKADRNTISHPEESKKQGDGFDFLRQKRTLESEADKVLNESKK